MRSVLISLRLSTLHSSPSLSSSLVVLVIFIFIFHVGWFGENPLCASANEESRSSADNNSCNHLKEGSNATVTRNPHVGHHRLTPLAIGQCPRVLHARQR